MNEPKLHDYEHSFKAPNGVPSCCRIRIYTGQADQNGMVVVVCSQLPQGDERAGMSVTNAAEYIASEIVAKHLIEPNRLVWIENYPQRGHLQEDFDRVTFAGRFPLIRPHWTRLSRETVEKWIGWPL